jgi:hypothetical protein
MSLELSDLSAPTFIALINGNSVSFSSIEEKFEALESAWDDEHPASSIVNYDSLSYDQIIGMGAAVVSILMGRLRAGEGQWIYALTCITGVQAHSDEMLGDPDRIIGAWDEWYSHVRGRHNRITS